MTGGAPSDPLVEALRTHFGHSDFRPGQRPVVEAVQDGRDVVVVMPTGGGKSLCYQLPAVLGDRPTVVVSPLIALMNDQIQALRARGVPAEALHSNLDRITQRRVEADWGAGRLRLLYVAPERLVRQDFRALMATTRPARLVVDEAHCISEWGHDFRRDYLRIAAVAAELGGPQIVACTATATPEVREDIIGRLSMRSPASFVHGFARPNLHLAVERVRSEADKLVRIEEALDPGDGHAIVYAGTRARAELLAQRLGRRFAVMLYHGDLTPERRARAQEGFASGAVRVAVTTSAFGMGVDIPTVRQVLHAALPASLEEYYQQAGRAGRDGLPARCLMVHTAADRRLPEFFIDAAHPDSAVVSGVYRSLRAAGSDPGAWRAVAARDPVVGSLSDAAGDAAREILAHAGVITADGTVAEHHPARLPVDHGRIAAHRRVAHRRLERLLAYLRPADCRHRTIAAHFGDQASMNRCGDRCDVCLASDGETASAVEPVVVQQALSAVARLNGRVGLGRIAGVLVGSSSAAVRSTPGATSIPTYGALRGWREEDALELLRRLVDVGALALATPPYPTASVTAAGVAALRGVEIPAVADPRPRVRPPARGAAVELAAALDADQRGVLARLRAWRTDRARARGVPAYVVFGDRTLLELAVQRPRGRSALLQVPGIGPAKLELYGDELLALVGAAAGPAAGAAEDRGQASA